MFLGKINAQTGEGPPGIGGTGRGDQLGPVCGTGSSESEGEDGQGETGSRRSCRRLPKHLGYRCEQVLKFYTETIERDGIAPSYNQICDELGISSRGKVCEIIDRLERRGLIKRVGKFKVPRNTHSRNIRRGLLVK